jgi:hypothetical protein
LVGCFLRRLLEIMMPPRLVRLVPRAAQNNKRGAHGEGFSIIGMLVDDWRTGEELAELFESNESYPITSRK